jgi:hypothetical protein
MPMSDADRVKADAIRARIISKMMEYQHPETSLEEAAEHLTRHGWREVNWDDERTVVTLNNGYDFIDITLTPPEKADAIVERSHGAFTEREFNSND